MISNYPPGAYNDKDAPYNQKYKEIEAELIIAKQDNFKIPADIYDEESIKEEILKQVDIPKGYEIEDIIIWS